MKKILSLLTIVAFSSNLTFSQTVVKRPRVTAEGKNVTISYGQPIKASRDIFGKLVPYGKVWRTGENEATEITFAKDATFGGKPIKAGTYALFTIPEKTKWTFILNSELKQWGAFEYDKIKGKDVLQVTAPASTINGAPVEKLTISLPAGKLVLEWDKTKVEVPIKS
jgi:hypothetical protein